MTALNPNQTSALEALASGHTVEQASIVAGVTERTIYKWKRQPEFKAELQRMTDTAIDDSVVFLSSCLRDAFNTMNYLCISAKDETTRLAAAKSIADSILKIRQQHEIVKRINELEDQINDITQSD